jgi:hypothetical protein
MKKKFMSKKFKFKTPLISTLIKSSLIFCLIFLAIGCNSVNDKTNLQLKKLENRYTTLEVQYKEITTKKPTGIDPYTTLIIHLKNLLNDYHSYTESSPEEARNQSLNLNAITEDLENKIDNLINLKPMSEEDLPGIYDNLIVNYQLRFFGNGDLVLVTSINSTIVHIPGKWMMQENKISISVPGFVDQIGEQILKRDGLYTTKGSKSWKKISSFTFKPDILIATERNNVLYFGIPNPIKISVPGYKSEQLIPYVTGGKISRCYNKDMYDVTPENMTDFSISLTVRQGQELKKIENNYQFRVRPLPDPIAKVGGKESGVITKALLLASGGVAAVMKDFDFDLRVTVASYTVALNVGGEFKTASATGNNFTGEITTLLQKVKNNGRVIFEDIKVRMPNGTVRTLPTLTLKVNG